MTAKLPAELHSFIAAHPEEAFELIDEQTRTTYVLLPADEFRRLKTAAEDELADTYSVQIESAMRAGWDSPLMDEYDDYDSHRRQM